MRRGRHRGALTRTDTYSGPLLAALLIFPVLGLAAAPLNSLAARRAALPADLRQRRPGAPSRILVIDQQHT